MTRRFHAKFANGVIVPEEQVDLPVDRRLTFELIENEQGGSDNADAANAAGDAMPKAPLALLDWVKRQRLQIRADVADKFARSKSYDLFGAE